MTNETNEQKAQEVEAKGWTWKFDGEHNYTVYDDLGMTFTVVHHVDAANEITDRFNELDRLRSSMGKVPSDADIKKQFPDSIVDFYHSNLNRREGAEWMRSEVAPVIAGLQVENRDAMQSVFDLQKQIGSLRSELKQAKEALTEFVNDTDAHNEIGYYTKKFTALLTPKKEEK